MTEGFGEAIGNGLMKIIEQELLSIAKEEAKKIQAKQAREAKEEDRSPDSQKSEKEQETLKRMTGAAPGSADDLFNRRTSARKTSNRSTKRFKPPR